jgi:hypothetical protein
MRQYPDNISGAVRKHGRATAKGVLALLALAPLAAWTGQGTPVAAVQQPAAGATGAIVSAIGGKCLSNYPNYVGQGLVAGIDECTGSSAERWTLPSDNTVRVEGDCLAVKKKAAGTGLVLAKCEGSAAQFWEADGLVEAAGVELINPWSGKCMTDPNGTTVDDTQVRLYACTRSAAQTWYLPPRKPLAAHR